jgi:hypothetical protein
VLEAFASFLLTAVSESLSLSSLSTFVDGTNGTHRWPYRWTGGGLWEPGRFYD